MEKTSENIFNRKPLVMYIILAFTFTWLILSPGVAANLGLLTFEMDGTILTILGGLGPLLAAVIVTYAIDGNKGLHRIFRSMFNWQVKVRWWLAAVLLLAGLFSISILLGIMAGGSAPDPKNGLYLNGGNLIFVILLLFVGSFGEEPGWRGFVLPRLQEDRSPMKATLLLTIIWWLWHLPTYWTLPFAIDARLQFGFVVAFGIQLVVLLALSILCTWVFNGSSGSVLMPVLLHASWNFWSGAFGQEASMLLMPLMLLTAIVVGFASKGKLGLRE
jgi:membrane protease YdiL (CAAX protease family)